MGFGLQFQKSVEKGIPQGLQLFLSNKKMEATAQREQEKRKEKLKAENDKVIAQSNVLGVDFLVDPDTRVHSLDIPEDFEVPEISQADRLKFLPETGTQFQSILKGLEQPKDFFVNKRKGMNTEGEGAVFAIDTNPESENYGNEVEIGKAPDYQFKISDETYFDGEIDFEGQKIGVKGKRSKLIQYENGKFDIIQGVSDIKGDGTDKPIEAVKFESSLAKIMVDKQKALERYDTYIKKGVGDKGFGNERARDLKRQRINADLNRVAWDMVELGSDEAQEYMSELYEEGRHTINQGFEGMPDSRKDYYERKLAEVMAQNERGEWGHEDFTSILQFMQAKYRDYVVSQDPTQDSLEFTFDIPEFQLK